MKSERPRKPKPQPGQITMVIADAGDFSKRPLGVRLRQAAKYLLRAWNLRLVSIQPTADATANGGPA